MMFHHNNSSNCIHYALSECANRTTTSLRSTQTTHSPSPTYVLYVVFAVVFALFLVFMFWNQFHSNTARYHRLVGSGSSPDRGQRVHYDGILDEEYEHTFVGVSVPLLQEVTKI